MTKKQKRNLKRIIIAICCFLVIFITDLVLKKAFGDRFINGIGSLIPGDYGWLLSLGLYLLLYIYIGHDVLKKAFLNIGHGQLLDENFLMVLATLGAFSLGIYRALTNQEIEGFDEGCAVLIFYQVGEWFQNYALGKSRKSISSLMDIRPDFASLVKEDGSIEVVDPSIVKVNDIIIVKPGEKIPLDGVIIKGFTSLDTKALTGESLPKEVGENSSVISGTINLTNTIQIRVEKEFYDSTVSKILDLVENASNHKSKQENFITKFSKVYTPIVVFASLIVGIVVGLVTKMWDEGLYRALTFLVVSCPCALVISIPLSFFAGIGGASSNGVLIKGSCYLDLLNKANIFVFDKTGTLTKGNFVVSSVSPIERKDEILSLASIAEKNSNHPIANSIKKAYGKEDTNDYSLEDISGKGIKATFEDDVILCGNEKLMKDNNIDYVPSDEIGTIIHVAKNNEYVGSIAISDEIKENAKETIETLNNLNAKTIMLTGDNENIASKVASKIGLSDYRSSLLPQNKVEEVEKIILNKSNKDIVCFVGDGINDAPVLMRADLGISMGGVGSDAAIEASDIVLMYDDLNAIVKAKKLAKKVMRIVYENIYFAIGVKILILIISAFGLLGSLAMWIAVFGDVGVSVIAILNSMRAMR